MKKFIKSLYKKIMDKIRQHSPVPDEVPAPVAEGSGVSPVQSAPEEVKVSPITTFPFSHMFGLLERGEKIHNTEWPAGVYVTLSGGVLKLYKEDGKLYDWMISLDDIRSGSWSVYKPTDESK